MDQLPYGHSWLLTVPLIDFGEMLAIFRSPEIAQENICRLRTFWIIICYYTKLLKISKNFIILKDFNPDRNKHNMQFLQVHAIFALGECNSCTIFSLLVSGISDGHSGISNSRASRE